VLPGNGQVGSGDAPATTDLLDVLVPQNYRGNLKIGAASGSEVELGTWSGGTLETYLLGRGLFTADTLDSLTKAVVDVSGDGSVQIKSLTTATFVANVNGKGKISVGSGHAEVSNATISGDGSILLKGNYKNLKQAVQGQGTISVTD
jgi:hypothetical protein